MRLTPSQGAIHLICGEDFPMSHGRSMLECMREGHELLVSITGKDFGYDLQAWHDHLKESREGGYTYGRNIVLPRIMQKALQSAEWKEAIQVLTAKKRID